MSRPLGILEDAFASAIRQVAGFDADPLLRPSADAKFGDYQCNAAMGLAKKLSQATGEKHNPRDLATKLVEVVDLGEIAEPLNVAGPGFINITLRPDWLAADLQRRAADAGFGIEPAEVRQTVVVEYSSPNIAKQLHVGHLPGTLLGDCIARVLEALGHNVIRQNHLGDWGTQFGMLIARLKEIGGSENADIKDLDAFYKQAKSRYDEDEAFAAEARETVVRLQRGDDAEQGAWQALIDATRAHYLPLYRKLGVDLNVEHERGESTYNERLGPLTDELLAAGVLEESEGAIVSHHGGFAAPLMVRKSNGGFGYGTTDLAAAEYRARELGVDRSIYFVDVRQSQHFKQVFATVAAAADKAGWPTGDVVYEHASYGTILGPDGRPLKTKTGDPIKLADLLAEAVTRARSTIDEKNPDLPPDEQADIAEAVGIGAVKYFELSRDRNSDHLFSWDDMLSFTGNTGPYLQYAYCRIQSIFRKAGDVSLDGIIPSLDAAEELALGKHLVRFGEVIEQVARELMPHYLCNYLYELATKFSSFFENCPVLTSDEPLRSGRLALCDLTGKTLAHGLDLLGIRHPEQM